MYLAAGLALFLIYQFTAVAAATCKTHTVQPNTWCALIADQYQVTVANIKKWNKNTWRWKGCSGIQPGDVICVSAGDPPPIPINPDAQCGPQTSGNKTCPLNVCCSAFGYCGMTDEFCKPAANGDPCWSNCNQPKLDSCSGTGSLTLKRKLGYYAGWATRRSCDPFKPENLNLDGYTGIIFAFAEISEDYKTKLDSRDDAVLKDLVEQKNECWPNVKVSIAVGGWTFSMADPTRTIFSRMLATSSSRATFISSVKSFIGNYGLNGVDIDLEYPAAQERAAPAEDTPNLTSLFSEMRSSLGTGTIISLATPAGYWFLRGFQLDKIQNSLDYFNMMSYDYHGPWDLDVSGEDGTAKPQTDTRDITTSMNLYKRIGVKFDKLNLGLAWYGRSYAVSNCKGMGCKMTGGGKPGSCTGESGVKSQVEVWREIKANNIKPTLDSASSTYWYNYNGDFITYDGTETWNKKTQMAGNTCFGGTFVWSLDQTTPSTPPPVVEDYDVTCQHTASKEVLDACKTMVNDIFDTNEYNLNGTDKCFAAGALKPFPCYKGCCLFLGVEKYQDVNIRAKEVKDAALQVLKKCHGVNNNREALQMKAGHMRVFPLIVAWLASAIWSAEGFLTMASIIGTLAKMFADWTWDDSEDRGEYVLETLGNVSQKHPDWDVVMVHSEHTMALQEPCYHAHVEFDRPAPWGTYGYEIYLARRGELTLKGDGGYLNWAYVGVITQDPENKKHINLYPPGANYGLAWPVKARHSKDTSKTVNVGVSLGSYDGCATSFGMNSEDGNVVRCTDIDIDV